jgi:predicted DNA-binding protein (MmcQ/YjbR family)
MDILEFRRLCLDLPLAEETTPFDEDTLVYKIGGKMFAYTGMADFRLFNVKAPADRIPELMERHPEIGDPVHMARGHWISVDARGDLPVAFLRDLVATSYRLVIEGMTKKQRIQITEAIAEAGYTL